MYGEARVIIAMELALPRSAVALRHNETSFITDAAELALWQEFLGIREGLNSSPKPLFLERGVR